MFYSLRFLILFLFFVLIHPLSLKAQQEDAYLALIDSSFVAGDRGEYEASALFLRRAIALCPDQPLNIKLLNNLAGLEQLLGQPDKAIITYTAALVKSPKEDLIRYNRARLYALRGNTKAALTDYALLVASNPKNELYRYQRAMTYMLSGELDLAEADLEELIRQNPETLKGRLGYALLKTSQKKYDEAERIYDYLVERLPKTAEVYEGRSRMYLARKMLGYAMRDVNKAFELSVVNIPSTLFHLRAEVSRALGYERDALRDEATAMRLEKQQLIQKAESTILPNINTP